MSLENQIRLKKSAILNIPLSKFDNDFTFFVNDEYIQTSRIIADLISPKICQFHITDPTINEITIKTQKQGHFSYILDLINFESNDIPDEELPFITEVIELLKIDKIEINLPQKDSFTFEKSLQALLKNQINNNLCLQRDQIAIEFLSSSLYKIESHEEIELLSKLNNDILEKIFSHSKIQLKSEDQLLSIINDLYLLNSSFSYLYEFVQFVNVSSEGIKTFLEIFNEDDMTRQAWIEISKRLIEKTTENLKENKGRYVKIHCKNKIIKQYFGEAFRGIIWWLTNEFGCNLNDKGIINITGNRDVSFSPSFYGTFSSLVDYDYSKNCYKSANEPNSSICFDFKEHKIKVDSYSIKSSNLPNPSCLKSWVLEGSDDSEKWNVIDERVDDSSLVNDRFPPKFCVFKAKFSSDKMFKFIRLRMTGKNSNNNWALGLTNIEFFGEYY